MRAALGRLCSVSEARWGIASLAPSTSPSLDAVFGSTIEFASTTALPPRRRSVSSTPAPRRSSPSPPRDHGRARRPNHRPSSVSPSKFMRDVFERASARPKRILMNEPGDARVLAAASALAERGLCVPVLLGDRLGIDRFAARIAREMSRREKEELEGAGENGGGGVGVGGRSARRSSVDRRGDAEDLPADVRFLRGLSRCEIVDPYRREEVGDRSERYAEELASARKHKGMTLSAARELLSPEGGARRSAGATASDGGDVSPGGASIYFSTMMLRSGDADGLLSGASHTTLETVRPALQLLRKGAGGRREAGDDATSGGVAPPGLVSSLFFMCLPRGVVAYADCALNVSPSPGQLARIALDSAATASAFGLVPPRVAMLSYSTRGSGRGPGPEAAAEAAGAARLQAPPGVYVDGPLQYDAAVSPSVAALKLSGEAGARAADGGAGGGVGGFGAGPPHPFDVAGRANVLVFPSLDAGNIAYKAVQQSTSAAAVGPVLQGLSSPVNDLSRGASVDDIVCTAAVTAVQAIAASEERERERGGAPGVVGGGEGGEAWRGGRARGTAA